jgi:hypothetical protein
MYVWQMPIPAFDAHDPRHVHLAQLAADAEKIAPRSFSTRANGSRRNDE